MIHNKYNYYVLEITPSNFNLWHKSVPVLEIENYFDDMENEYKLFMWIKII